MGWLRGNKIKRFVSSVMLVVALVSSFIPLNEVHASPPAYHIFAYITWGNLSSVWGDGTTFSAEPSLNYVTDLIGPAIVPHSNSNPYVEGMYGDVSIFSYVSDAANAHGLTSSPYLYMGIDDLISIIDGGHLSTLVSSTASLISTYGLDGIGLDIEGGTNQAYMNALVDAMYASLNPSGKFITIAAQYGQFPGLVPDITVAKQSEVAYITPMCYDLWSYGDQSSGYPQATVVDSEAIMASWVSAGFSKSKLAMGIPFYGKSSASTTLEYRTIVDALSPADGTDSGSVSGTTYWWGGKNTDKTKADWIVANGYAGVMVFALGYDKLNTSYSLIAAIHGEMNTTPPPLVSISVSPASPAHLKVGLTQQFAATGYYSDNSNATVTSSVTWASSNAGVATISAGGLATGVSVGTALITANMSGVFSANITLTVKSLSSIAVTPNPATNLASGGTEQFTATGTYTDSSNENLSSSVTWVSSNTSVATLNSSGKATGLALGSTNISANKTGIFSANVSLTVVAPSLSSITVSPSSPASLKTGLTQQFSATGHYTDTSTANLTSSVTWATSNVGAATISASGLATGVAAGNTNISANYSGISSSNVALTVKSLSSIVVSAPASSIALFQSEQFTTSAVYTDSSTETVNANVTWHTSNPSVATITSNGLALGVGIGTTYISSNMSGFVSNNFTLTVKTLSSIAVTPNPATNLGVGSTENFAATGTYSDNSTGDMTAVSSWVSSNTTVATISSGGLVTALAVGTTNISANKAGIYSANVSLTVLAPAATLLSIVVTPAYPPSLAVGHTQQFIATGFYDDNSTVIITATVVWLSSDVSKASIGGTGLATGVAVGSTGITAHGGAVASPSVIMSIYNSTFTPTYVGTSGTAFTKEFYPFFIVLAPVLIGLKMFEGGGKPISSLFLLMIIIFLIVAFLPTIVGAVSGL